MPRRRILPNRPPPQSEGGRGRSTPPFAVQNAATQHAAPEDPPQLDHRPNTEAAAGSTPGSSRSRTRLRHMPRRSILPYRQPPQSGRGRSHPTPPFAVQDAPTTHAAPEDPPQSTTTRFRRRPRSPHPAVRGPERADDTCRAGGSSPTDHRPNPAAAAATPPRRSRSRTRRRHTRATEDPPNRHNPNPKAAAAVPPRSSRSRTRLRHMPRRRILPYRPPPLSGRGLGHPTLPFAVQDAPPPHAAPEDPPQSTTAPIRPRPLHLAVRGPVRASATRRAGGSSTIDHRFNPEAPRPPHPAVRGPGRASATRRAGGSSPIDHRPNPAAATPPRRSRSGTRLRHMPRRRILPDRTPSESGGAAATPPRRSRSGTRRRHTPRRRILPGRPTPESGGGLWSVPGKSPSDPPTEFRWRPHPRTEEPEADPPPPRGGTRRPARGAAPQSTSRNARMPARFPETGEAHGPGADVSAYIRGNRPTGRNPMQAHSSISLSRARFPPASNRPFGALRAPRRPSRPPRPPRP